MDSWVPDHVPLPVLKILCPRVLYHAAEQEVDSERGTAFADELRHQSEASARATERAALDSSVTGNFLVLMRNTIPRAQSELDRLTAVLSVIDCVQCAGKDRTMCAGVDLARDAENVERGGQCIGPLKEYFQAAIEVSRRYYQRYCPTFWDYPTHFETKEGKSEGVHDIPVPYCITGLTTVKEDYSAIQLQIKAADFDRESFHAIPYVLFHEAICHAFQGTVSNGQRAACGENDEFGEGWMDWIAYRVLQRFLRRPGPNADLIKAIRTPERAARIGERFHEERKNHEARKPSRLAGVNHRGCELGRRVAFLMRDLRATEESFIALSLRMNVLPLTKAERRDLVQQLRWDVEPVYGSNVQRTPKECALAPALAKYLEEGRSATAGWRGAVERLVGSVLARHAEIASRFV